MNHPFVMDTVYSFNDFLNYGNYKRSEFFEVNGIEYVAFETSFVNKAFVKRDLNGSYTAIEMPLNVSNSIKFDFIPINGNQLLYISPKVALILDENLSFVSSVEEDFLFSNNNSINNFFEAKQVGSYIYVYSSSEFSLYKYDMNMNFIESKAYDRQLYPTGIITFNSKSWVTGITNDIAENQYYYIRNSLFIIEDPEKVRFDEHFQLQELNNFKMNLGNYKRVFPFNSNGTASLTYIKQDTNNIDNYYSIIFENGNALLGYNSNNELVGIWSNYADGGALLPGPIYNSVLDTNFQIDKYNRSYYVTNQMIADHIDNVGVNPNYEIPNAINYWPGNGESMNGEEHLLANFVDLNANSYYEP